VAQVVKEKRPLLISNVNTRKWRKKYNQLASDTLMYSELAVPLFSNDGRAVVGVLNVESQKPDAFTGQDQDCLLALARRAQMVVQRASLSEVIRTLSQKMLTMDRDALLIYTVEALSDLMHVPVCSIWLIDLETGDLRLEQAIGRRVMNPKNEDSRLLSGPRRAFCLVRPSLCDPIPCLDGLQSAPRKPKWTHWAPPLGR
jgi:GAF domain-containing protein